MFDDESMAELVESIKEYGLLNRIIVRPLEDKQDEYEIISGHRRVHAAELLEMKEVTAIVGFGAAPQEYVINSVRYVVESRFQKLNYKEPKENTTLNNSIENYLTSDFADLPPVGASNIIST